jgi:two-component system response regulator NreC
MVSPTHRGAPAATVVLAEDHHLVREGLRALLAAEPGLSVIGETGDGLEVVDLVGRTRPDVLVLDMMMPGLGGLDAAREVTRRFPRTRIVILSMHDAEPFVVQALRAGALAYVLKESTAGDLVRAIREVMAGRRYLSRPLSPPALAAYGERAVLHDAYETLTAREREVLHLAAEGLSNPDIGRRLRISPRTAETHRAHLMRKLGLRTRPDLVAYALARGLLPDERDPRRSG